jgi:hypothetical protein
MMITISRPIEGISINGDEWLLDDSGNPLGFETMNEAIQFFADHNFSIEDLLGLNFHVEEEEEANSFLLTEKECDEAIASRRR